MTLAERFKVPPARNHGLLTARKTMGAEIAELRKFINDVLIETAPERYTLLKGEIGTLEQDRIRITAERDQTQQAVAELLAERDRLDNEVVKLRDDAILQEVGVYDYRHPMESAYAYKDALDSLKGQIKDYARAGNAVSTTSQGWTVNGDEREGRKMVRDMSKLLLRAYNNEADTLADKLRPFRLEAAINKLDKSRDAINKLGAQPMQIAITPHYHGLRVKELELKADWLEKKEEEKEEAKAERARLREEAKARKEIEAEEKRLLKERAHYQALAEKLQTTGAADTAALAELDEKIAEIDEAFAAVEERAANTRAGYVYVISNVGAFGGEVVKIGMTRRLDPMDRVKELGDASVPFRYDVHALVFSDDAVELEQHLHKQFEDRRVNLVNQRREFFYVTPTDVREALATHDSAVLAEFVEEPEAAEWHMSENARSANGTG